MFLLNVDAGSLTMLSMVKITKVYTRTGDEGSTSVLGKERLSKSDARIKAIGDVDELNALLGWVIVGIDVESLADMKKQCIGIQHELFDLGAQLAVLPAERIDTSPNVSSSDVNRLEQELDDMNQQLPSLTSFVLPGGNELTARLHIARTVCRRVERQLVSLHEEKSLNEAILPYVNRLSDWLFVAARFVSLKLQIHEHLWEPGKR